MDTKKGFVWAIGVWSLGAVLHAFCGIATSGLLTGHWFVGFGLAQEHIHQFIETTGNIARVLNVSVVLFIFARLVLALGEAGNFPAAIKTTAEYFPKKDRAYATSIRITSYNVCYTKLLRFRYILYSYSLIWFNGVEFLR